MHPLAPLWHIHRVVENQAAACLDGLHQVVVCTLWAQAPAAAAVATHRCGNSIYVVAVVVVDVAF